MRGYVRTSSESYTFRRCDSAEVIWVDLLGWNTILGHERLDEALTPIGSCSEQDAARGRCVRLAYAELRGELSEKGTWGHLGKYEHQLKVLEVMMALPGLQPNCGFQGPDAP